MDMLRAAGLKSQDRSKLLAGLDPASPDHALKTGIPGQAQECAPTFEPAFSTARNNS